ncbi:hypothetical protein [Mediterranea massiliensis]|uniref:hypothetical protein n=1 Tax=Mediterranea massiliensis TaxID=1841865 RepID=UPI00266C7596|nr:hypothetical protein [Mediterranea massiliensis]
MDNPKELAELDPDNYDYPLANVSHLSEKEKKDLLKHGMRIPKELQSDEEFEQWVTVFSEWNTYSYSDGHKPTEEEINFEKMVTASYERGLWYHRKRFNEWKKEHLQPLIDELAEHAAHDPQYDWQILYELEYAKLRCMRSYFSHSLIADENGNFGFNRWIDICISLLKYIKDDDLHISRQQIDRMNIRNVGDIVSSALVDAYEEALMSDEEEDNLPEKLYYGKKIYVRKMERLYYRIRLYKMREWWE